MVSTGFMWLALSIAGEVTGTSSIKKTEGFTKLKPSIICIMGYVICYYALAKSMAILPVGIAYSLWCGVGLVGVTFFGMVLYKQKPDKPALLAMSLILAGIIGLNILI